MANLGTATIDLDALRDNYTLLRGKTTSAVAAVVKANAYGHGMSEVANALNAPLSCVAQMGEALELRESFDGDILTWIWAPGQNVVDAIHAGLDISIGATWQIAEIEKAVAMAGQPARIHIELDTGMSRGGIEPRQVDEVANEIARLGERVNLRGVWSHLARADEPDSGETERATALFTDLASRFPGVARHLAATGGLLWHPATHFDLVRAGISLYGMSPAMNVETAEEIGLKPVMTLTAPLIAVREIEAGDGVSYGHLFRASETMRVGTVPVGYADGLPRSISGAVEVAVNGQMCRVLGRECMDQFVIELPESARPGDIVTIFGQGAWSVDEFATAAGTIGYEITTQLSPRLPRVYVGA